MKTVYKKNVGEMNLLMFKNVDLGLLDVKWYTNVSEVTHYIMNSYCNGLAISSCFFKLSTLCYCYAFSS